MCVCVFACLCVCVCVCVQHPRDFLYSFSAASNTAASAAAVDDNRNERRFGICWTGRWQQCLIADDCVLRVRRIVKETVTFSELQIHLSLLPNSQTGSLFDFTRSL